MAHPHCSHLVDFVTVNVYITVLIFPEIILSIAIHDLYSKNTVEISLLYIT